MTDDLFIHSRLSDESIAAGGGLVEVPLDQLSAEDIEPAIKHHRSFAELFQLMADADAADGVEWSARYSQEQADQERAKVCRLVQALNRGAAA